MPIFREDGTPFQVAGRFQQFNPNGPQNIQFTRWDEEVIRIGGSPLLYYECLIQFSTLDKLFLEDRGKIFSPCPVQLYAFYEPPEQVAGSGLYQVDTPDMEVIFECNYNAVIRDIGHLPKIGSRIYSPHLCENWVLIDRRSAEYRGWGVLRMHLHCRKFQETNTNNNGQVTKNTDFPINL